MMNWMSWDPWRDVQTLHQAVNRLWEEGFGDRRYVAPRGSVSALALDMYETPDTLVVKARVPGARPEDIDISVQQGVLTIRGHIPSDAETEGAEKLTWIVHELGHGDFSRSISLPTSVDPDRAEARFENGQLTLTLPKTEAARPRQIPVSSHAAIGSPR